MSFTCSIIFNIFYLIFVFQEPFWYGFVYRRDELLCNGENIKQSESRELSD